MLEAEILLKYESSRLAKSVMNALAPDNKSAGGVRIRAKTRGSQLKVLVSGCERVETLQATIQDIFRCVRAAESSLLATA
jgi:hypothetical protein